ncbi:MAG: putative IIA-like nitrogen-regulatory protein PtsN [Firmicutes bacterium]|nr:putative IIA-like nitrogen-regulatory protein PtsN [Bacillota bacterium]
MELLDIIKEDTVFLGLEAANREECVAAMLAGMEKAGLVKDAAAYLNALNEREAKGTTAIGFGVAIPHGKSDGMAAPGLAFAQLKTSIDWNSLDGSPVQLVFMIGVPMEAAGDEHIKILIALSRKLIHADFREKLLAVQSKQELFQVLQGI